MNAADRPVTVLVKLLHDGNLGSVGQLAVLTASSPEATNSITGPDRIKPAVRDLESLGTTFQLQLPALSISVLDMRAGR